MIYTVIIISIISFILLFNIFRPYTLYKPKPLYTKRWDEIGPPQIIPPNDTHYHTFANRRVSNYPRTDWFNEWIFNDYFE